MTLSKIIKHVMSSASEAEMAALFYKLQGSGSITNNFRRNGPPTAPHPCDNRQFDNPGTHYKINYSKGCQVLRHEVQLPQV